MDHLFTITGTVMSIHLPAELDHHNSKRICEETDRLIQKKNIRCVLFDFSDTTFMDSSGIGMLIGRYKMMRFMGGTVLAVHVGKRMNRILTLAGIYKIIDIYEDVPEELNKGH
ncbi:MAG: anti-sigma factor antagonist [Lachnospiraceae bacterium]|nr:anti-sigma factor antagonist [Lachnospiraceae bacterium]